MTKNTTDFPKILIVGTVPYDPGKSSRALDTYFHNFPNDKLRMIYSNSKKPYNGFCESYFRITDYELLNKFLKRKGNIGTIFNTNDINSEKNDFDQNSKISKFKKRNTLRYYLRKILWSKKRWLTESLDKWVDDFKPEIIYICFSDDYFILDISYYFAKKYNIPIIAQIGDDYYFKKYRLCLRPYIKLYKKLFDKVMNTEGFGVYISDKLSDKYNSHFKKQGFPVYLSSSIKQSNNSIIHEFNYFGKTNLGRIGSLCLLGDLLKQINKSYYVSIYSDNVSKSDQKKLKRHNCIFKGFLKYDDAIKIMNSGAFNIIASGFSKKNIEDARYSLSTKIADSLICSGPIIAVGPSGDGAIDYLSKRSCAIIIDNKMPVSKILENSLANMNELKKVSSRATEIYYSEHALGKNRGLFEKNCIALKRGKI